MLSDKEISEIKEEFRLYPFKQAAVIEALKVVQKYHRWVSDEHLNEVAQLLEMSPDEVDAVATFYNLIFRKPVGRHVILVCSSISCWVMGYSELTRSISGKLGIGYGETTADGRFTLLPNPCLGTCDHAPAMMVDDDLYRDLTPESINEILQRYQ